MATKKQRTDKRSTTVVTVSLPPDLARRRGGRLGGPAVADAKRQGLTFSAYVTQLLRERLAEAKA